VAESSPPPPEEPSTETAPHGEGRAAEWAPSVGQWMAGNYRLERLVGTGGIGMVFAARDASLDRVVAIKVLRDETSMRPELQQALHDEARKLAAVRHPHIVTVYGCGWHRRCPYVVMELIEGSNALAALQRARGLLPVEDVLRILRAVASGLDELHRHDIVHGDVKPSNVLLGSDDQVKLTDVGMTLGSSQQLSIRGTPAFQAPERIVSGEGPSKPADLYAFGVTAFQLFTGRLPFLGSTADVLTRAVSTAPPAPSEIRPDLPATFDVILTRLLSKDPAERLPRSSEAVDQLARALAVSRSERQTQRHRAITASTESNGHIERIVVADDDPDLRYMLAASLPTILGHGCIVEGVPDGDATLAIAVKQMPDALVIDLQMPGMATQALVEAIRALPHGERVAIVVITGSGGASDWRALQAAGCDACLLKPFEAGELALALRRHASRRSAGR
jgi:eukaryotic-like serine/threonine-protein kinase